MSIVCLEQDRGITGCTYSMQSAIYIMYNTPFINIYFITTYCNCMEYFTLLIYSSLPLYTFIAVLQDHQKFSHYHYIPTF